ncbi:hypothetical protein SBV1_1930042 [Verrucomicrobia bacterium]|nr:hypothetical protein SBV1_1930042 [Verrucomicrobiota bacterium]
MARLGHRTAGLRDPARFADADLRHVPLAIALAAGAGDGLCYTCPSKEPQQLRLFPTTRAEIIIEGSDDSVTWLPYEFKYKPGDVRWRPHFVAPHQPRLDWQMWFAALGTYQQNPWFINFCVRLLEGSPPALVLLKQNPFPKAPPRYLRARAYDYHFTDWATRRKTGAWWRRTEKGEYLPVISLRGRTGLNAQASSEGTAHQ